ncbi:MAG: hypothetical protein ABL901_11620 [Hyphomicrobiaceae bacterium]
MTFDWHYERDERRRTISCFVDELSVRCNRSAELLEKQGLVASDFPRTDVFVQWEDGSNARIRHAFLVRRPDGLLVGIFSEHCGYFIIQSATLESIKEVPHDA